MNASPYRFIYLVVAAALLLGGNWQINRLAQTRLDSHLNARATLAGVPPVYALADGLLGGFRGFMISTLWQRAQEKKNNRQFYEMTDIYKIIAALEPNYPNAWANMAWDLSYNVVAEYENDPRERVDWVFRGVDMLRNEAIRHNPRSALLYDQVAWIFFNKMANSVDPAFPLYRRTLALEITDVLDGAGEKPLLEAIVATERKYGAPETPKIGVSMEELNVGRKSDAEKIARRRATGKPDPQITKETVTGVAGTLSAADGFATPRETFLTQASVQNLQQEFDALKLGKLVEEAYKVLRTPTEKTQPLVENDEKRLLLREAALLHMGGQMRDRYNMEVAVMLELDNEFAEIDWRLPQSHSLYWGWIGQRVMLEAKPDYDDMKFVRLIYFSLIQLAHQGAGILTESGLMIATPEPNMIQSLIRYMEGVIGKDDDEATVSGMKSAFHYFLLATVFNYYFADDIFNAEKTRLKLLEVSADQKYAGSLQKFLRQELPDFIDGLTERETMMLLVSFCHRAYRALVSGDPVKYREQMEWFEVNYTKLYQNWLSRFQGTFNVQEQFGLPTTDELRAQLAAQILAGRDETYADRKSVV
jgi:hypothetical protein